MFKLNSLQKKVIVLIILPLCLVLLLTGLIGMRLIGKVLLHQWEETAISKMERSAHNVDMRLMRPKGILKFFHKDGGRKFSVDDVALLVSQLRAIDGVVDVKYQLKSVNGDDLTDTEHIPRLIGSSVSPRFFDTALTSQTVSIVSIFKDPLGTVELSVEITVGFHDLIKQIVEAPWWKGNRAYILDKDGTILANTERGNAAPGITENHRAVFDQIGAFEAQTWSVTQKNKSGTVFSPGIPPEFVSGFYHLSEAPWTLVVIAEGKSVLKPIITFRNFYFLICTIVIICVAVYLWFIANKATRSINRVSSAATRLAQGDFGKPLPVIGKDEISDLTRSFNVMSNHLKERIQLRQDMNLAGEIQANLLPQGGFNVPGLEIATFSKYCDETGGDYVDLLNTAVEDRKATVVVGDVVGHGVGAALLMTTLRALLRSRSSMPGSPEEIVCDINKLLCDDTIRFGNFATLFLLLVDRSSKSLNWVRCGHDPALVYCPDTESFIELKGEGIAVGIDKEWNFVENSHDFFADNQVILIGTDGLWEVENLKGEPFGKERAKDLLRRHAHLPAEAIVEQFLSETERFYAGTKQSDDITLAIIRTF